MKTTFELPDDLVKEIKLLAVHEGKKLKDVVAILLRNGLAVASAERGTAVRANNATLKRRKSLTRKFVAGEWGVELAGNEAARKTDRRKAAKRATVWRE